MAALTIETERLRLRPPQAADAEVWTTILTDPEVARFLGPPVDSRRAVEEHVRTVLERHRADGFGLLAVVRKEDDRVIGRSGFLVWDRRTWASTTRAEAGEHAEVELGWTLARDCWGRGYATEAGEACRDHAFAKLDVPRLAAVIQHGNVRSTAVARRLGMSRVEDVLTAKGFEAQLWALTAEAYWASALTGSAGTEAQRRS